MNTMNRTVKGELEGETSKIAAMKTWLQTTGSPSSRIDKAVFSKEREVNEYSFPEEFQIKR